MLEYPCRQLSQILGSEPWWYGSWRALLYERHLQLPHARPQRLPGLVHPPRRVELPALFWLRRLVR